MQKVGVLCKYGHYVPSKNLYWLLQRYHSKCYSGIILTKVVDTTIAAPLYWSCTAIALKFLDLLKYFFKIVYFQKTYFVEMGG